MQSLCIHRLFVLTRWASNSLSIWGSSKPYWSSCCCLTRAGIQGCTTTRGLCVLLPHAMKQVLYGLNCIPGHSSFKTHYLGGGLFSISTYSPLLHILLILKVCPLGSISHYIAIWVLLCLSWTLLGSDSLDQDAALRRQHRNTTQTLKASKESPTFYYNCRKMGPACGAPGCSRVYFIQPYFCKRVPTAPLPSERHSQTHLSHDTDIPPPARTDSELTLVPWLIWLTDPYFSLLPSGLKQRPCAY